MCVYKCIIVYGYYFGYKMYLIGLCDLVWEFNYNLEIKLYFFEIRYVFKYVFIL